MFNMMPQMPTFRANPSFGFGMPNMGMPGMGMPGMGGVSQQQALMSSFGMLSMVMMEVMMRMMQAQVAMSAGPAQFGGGGGGGMMGGSPVGGFLGQGGGAPAAMGGAQAQGGGGSPGVSGPAGNVGNVNVDRLIQAIPEGYRSNARQHWPAIVAEAQKQGVSNKAQLAYILATTVHESGAGRHMQEIASGSAYEGRRDLGNTQSGDGVRYKGRGYVQITGRTNYSDWSRRLGMDLVGNPSLAERPEVAAKILVGGMKGGTFTGKKLDDYINGSKTDFNGARRIVNGTDKAGTFAATAQRILAAMG